MLNRLRLIPLIDVERRLHQQPRHAQDPIHRSTDLMTHVGQKDTFRNCTRLSGQAGPLHFLLQPNAFRDIPTNRLQSRLKAIVREHSAVQFDGDCLARKRHHLPLHPHRAPDPSLIEKIKKPARILAGKKFLDELP